MALVRRGHQLDLRGIPEIFVRLSRLKLLLGVRPLPLVVRMGFERLARPTRSSGEVIVVGWSPTIRVLKETRNNIRFLKKTSAQSTGRT